MKFIFIIASMLIVSNSFANEYKKRVRSAHCITKGDVSSLTQSKRILPSKIEFDVVVREYYLLKKHFEMPIKKEINISDNDFFNLKKADIYNLGKLFDQEGYDDLKFTLNSLDNQQSQDLLIFLGANPADVVDLNGNVPQLSFKLTDRHWREHKVQLHYPLNYKDGLSFHVQLTCYLKDGMSPFD